jgi:hypothetical protein
LARVVHTLDTANSVVTILATAVGVVLTGAGLYFAYNHRRQVQLQITEHRLQAYAGLWSITKVASPMRTPKGGSLSAEERLRLFDHMTDWYFTDGHGMLLDSVTREIYLRAKTNLVCPDEKLEPPVASGSKKISEKEREDLSISQFSLLRSQMKKDVEVYGVPFHADLSDTEKEFLRLCGADLRRPPWSVPWYQVRKPRSRRDDFR